MKCCLETPGLRSTREHSTPRKNSDKKTCNKIDYILINKEGVGGDECVDRKCSETLLTLLR